MDVFYDHVMQESRTISDILADLDPLTDAQQTDYDGMTTCGACLNVNVMLSNMTFLMIFAVFDPSPLTLWINCSF